NGGGDFFHPVCAGARLGDGLRLQKAVDRGDNAAGHDQPKDQSQIVHFTCPGRVSRAGWGNGLAAPRQSVSGDASPKGGALLPKVATFRNGLPPLGRRPPVQIPDPWLEYDATIATPEIARSPSA